MKFTFSAGDRPLAGYQLKRAIHRGGFGEVYYALTDAGKEVALKLLHDNMEVELRGVSQCLNLKHPHLVTIFDVKTDDEGDHWIVMEYINGKTLAELIDQNPNGLPASQVADLIAQCASGLQFLHDRGLVHRDIKPANIFVEADALKIGDVGLSKFISASHRSAHTQSVGTVHYMAPEVAKGKYGKGVDIYAIGIIAYEMLTGQVPFDGQSTGEILMKHLTEQPDLSRLDKHVAEVIGKALEKDEANRYQSVKEFQQALSVALLGKATVAAGEPLFAKDDGVQVAVGPGKRNLRTEKKRSEAAVKSSSAVPTHQHKSSGFYFWIVFFILAGMMLFGRVRSPAAILLLIAGSGCIALMAYSWRRFLDAQARWQVNPYHAPHAARVKQQTKKLPLALRAGWVLKAMSATPLYVGVMTAAVLFLSSDFFAHAGQQSNLDWGHLAFFVASSTLATWGLLAVNLMRSGTRESQQNSSLLIPIVGAVTGCAVFGMSQWFLVEYPRHIFPHGSTGIVSHIGQHRLAEESPVYQNWKTPSLSETAVATGENGFPREQPVASLEHPQQGYYPVSHQHSYGEPSEAAAEEAVAASDYDSAEYYAEPQRSWSPTLIGYALFFAVLFWSRSWGRIASVERASRVQLSTIAFSALVGYIICCIFTFPTVWGMTWAATVTAALQLAAPYAISLRTERAR